MKKNKRGFTLAKVLICLVVIGVIMAVSVLTMKIGFPTTTKKSPEGIRLTYIGHSGFFIEKNLDGILIDPFITGNPNTNFDYKKKRISHIFVTHAHLDHLGDAIAISKHTNAPIVAPFELANFCIDKGAKAIGINPGANLTFNWGSARVVNAVHSSSNPDLPYGGTPVGYLFDIDDTTIYHAGDTALMSDFSLIGELYNPHYALLPIGGVYTMGIEEAAVAAKMLYAKEVIPMHYNTFPQIKVDITKFVDLLEAQGQKCLPLKANEYVEL